MTFHYETKKIEVLNESISYYLLLLLMFLYNIKFYYLDNDNTTFSAHGVNIINIDYGIMLSSLKLI